MSSHIRVRRDRGRRRSSQRQVRGRSGGRRITGFPWDQPTDEKVQHPDVKNVPKFQEYKKRSSVKSPQQRLITD